MLRSLVGSEMCIRDSLLNDQQTQRASREREIVRLGSELLAAVEAAQSLNIHGSAATEQKSAQMLGISPEDFQASVMDRFSENQSVLVQALLPKIEASLRDKCDAIDNFGTPGAEQYVVGECSQLPQIVADRAAEIQQLELQVSQTTQTTQILGFQLAQSLGVLASKLQDYGSKVVLGTQHVKSNIEANWTMAEIRSLQLKLSSLELKAMSRTYSHDTVPALQKIRDRLDVSLHEAKAQVD
eukprot:TRINITY_DN9237_c0_g1_i4.p1 TRINITY_DN9237_c0_g1~~TRINITY_DN9237_c0_g1_i4.p1  ORF type:complete len:241 (-),score=56.45 TRINITY_DN9237_c0_g1_i4:576-1298(-)